MPLYPIRCPEHGDSEVYAPISEPVKQAPCPHPGCALIAVRVFSAGYASADASAEVRANDPDERTRGLNVGLPGVSTSLGKDKFGKEHFSYRPRFASEAGSLQKCKEIARQHGMTMVGGGARKTLP